MAAKLHFYYSAMNAKRFSIIVLLITVLGWVSINIYLPALPSLDTVFHTTSAHLKLSISLFLIAFGLSQFVWGSLSEKYGRKYPLVIGLIISVIGTVISMLAINVVMFNCGRFLEGLGLGSVAVLGRAILTDRFNKQELSVIMSYAATLANVMPAIAPIIGGYLIMWFNWRAIFVFLTVYTVILLWQYLRHVGETHPQINPDMTLSSTLKDYLAIARHKTFWGYVIPYMFLSGSLLGYYAATPFIFINHFHFSPQTYGYCAIITVITYIIGSSISRYLTKKGQHHLPIILGCSLTLLASLIMLALWCFVPFTIASVLAPMSLYTIGVGLVTPNANSGAMYAIAQRAGVAAAVIGGAFYACSSLFSAALTHFHFDSLLPLAVYGCIISSCAFLGFIMLVLRRKTD